MAADERLYIKDDSELGIKRPDVAEEAIQRSIDRYARAMEYCGVKGGHWLDAGCGSGYGTDMASRVAETVIGIDISEQAIVYAKKHHGGKAQFMTCDMGKLPAIRKMDVILALESIEHIDKAEQPRFLSSAYDLLEQDGVVVITTPMAFEGNTGSTNPYHKYELTLLQFIDITSWYFDETSYIIDKPVLFTDGKMTRQIFGICKKRRRFLSSEEVLRNQPDKKDKQHKRQGKGQAIKEILKESSITPKEAIIPFHQSGYPHKEKITVKYWYVKPANLYIVSYG